jgi:plastocyanin
MQTSMFKQSLVAILGIAVVLGALVGVNQAQALTDLDDINSGDLIRGESFAAVYYVGADGFRYVFPNQKTYDTWYTDFDDVKFISDSDLATIQIGGNVTYRPGVRMIKITSDPKTYAVDQGGVLRHVGSEEVAQGLYGSAWNKTIDDVPDGFFTNYTIGDEIESSSDYSATEAKNDTETINDDKNLSAPEEMNVTSSGYDPIDVTISVGETVRFTNEDDEKHSVTGDDLSWGSGTMQPGGTYLKRFDEEGVYTFFDSYDSSNTGAIYVE